jgi:tRNA pseudouridine55 synthase
MLTDWDKEYIAHLKLGVVTDTQDMTGRILSEADGAQLAELTEDEVQKCIMSFVGEYAQIPPMYSALKINGKKLYELARGGKEVERKSRQVQIREIEILRLVLPDVEFRVVCSKGTYIRTLCHDIGACLGVGGAMQSLVRSRVGIFHIEDAITLTQLEKLRDEDKISSVMISPDAIFEDDRAVCVTEQGRKMVQNGNCLRLAQLSGDAEFTESEQVRVYDAEGKFYGIYRYQAEEKLLRPVKMFLEV